MSERFAVHVWPPFTNREYYLDVTIHDTQADMYRLARRIDGNDIPDDIGGCIHSDYRPNIKRIGMMRLSREYLAGEYIIHESVHAGIVLAAKHYGCDPLRLRRTGSQREEMVAYAAHKFAVAIIGHVNGLDLREVHDD